ncbi:sigma-70 family RNA polymerase sigma factor [Sphingomonas sp. LB-2]|uniref:sigma-70 family RNA polymerase sigma factor n=1 Tax=Sphingomonas caeni TaxID=2984949 RepID=UPI00222E730F|nr:sigma-70 family RNA polymerase sigma factor [Sphingomonas caeni]MCW3848050.1 sigma-70 family RNA polymerase sigma factor [Sphingomonas caeni]
MSRDSESLEALLREVANGDKRAFRRVYDLAGGRLLAITLKILRDRQTAEDATQEAFLRIWRNAARYDPARGAPLAWMGVIARNAALDMAQVRRPQEELDAADTIELATPAVEPPDARLGQCLKRLPSDQARAIVTMYTYGMSHSELAEHLSVPLGTVKSWVRRGTESLKECMTF